MIALFTVSTIGFHLRLLLFQFNPLGFEFHLQSVKFGIRRRCCDSATCSLNRE